MGVISGGRAGSVNELFTPQVVIVIMFMERSFTHPPHTLASVNEVRWWGHARIAERAYT